MRDKILIKDIQFLPQWDRRHFAEMENAILAHFLKKGAIVFNGQELRTPRTWEEIRDLIGLPYTSSSSCAGYWVANGQLSYNSPENNKHGFRYVGFTISKGGKYCAICKDKDENELNIEL